MQLRSPILFTGSNARLARFRQRHGLTVAKMCALFGISTQTKYNAMVRETNEEPIDLTIGMTLRLFEIHEELIPLNNEFSLTDAYDMFRRVFGAEHVNESVFGILMGRSAGSGYRWLSGAGNATPQVGVVLERLFYMLKNGCTEIEACMVWLNVVHLEMASRGLNLPLAHVKPAEELKKLYPLKYRKLTGLSV